MTAQSFAARRSCSFWNSICHRNQVVRKRWWSQLNNTMSHQEPMGLSPTPLTTFPNPQTGGVKKPNFQIAAKRRLITIWGGRVAWSPSWWYDDLVEISASPALRELLLWYWQPEVASDVKLWLAVEDISFDVEVKFTDSESDAPNFQHRGIEIWRSLRYETKWPTQSYLSTLQNEAFVFKQRIN